MNFAAALCRRFNVRELVTKAPVYNGLHGVEGGLGLMIRRWATGSTRSGWDSRSKFLGVNTNNTNPLEKTTAEHVEQAGRGLRSMNFIQSIISEEDEQFERKAKDIVHILLIHNNTFVTLTDAKGNKKTGASSGSLDEFKGGARISRYAAEATAEHVGRSSRNLGLKSVVMKVKGYTYFRKKKAVILSWKEGAGDPSKIMYVRDVTQLPHNGCRLPKKRRV